MVRSACGAFVVLLLTAGAVQAQDAINLSQVAVYNSPIDVASWPITTRITRLEMQPNGSPSPGISLTFSAQNTWPDYTPPGWDGPLQYTVWAVVKINGQWNTSGFIQMWRGRGSTGAPILSDFAINWAYDSRWGPMNHYQPHVGEAMGFFVTAGNARGVGTVTSVRERSNVVVVNLPANDTGVFTSFPSLSRSRDFNGDGFGDLVVRNYVTGQNSIILMNGTTPLSTVALPTIADTNWTVVAAGDLNGDGMPDLVWRHAITGQMTVWFMNGTSMASWAYIPASAIDNNWQIMDAADMNGDGMADLLWRNNATGANVIWYMRGASIIGSAWLPTIADRNWHLVATGDFNGDGNIDLVWRNSSTGVNTMWFMNGASLSSWTYLTAQPDLNWQIVGAEDMNSDNIPDLLWHNTSTGANQVWFMNGAAQTSTASLPASVPNWQPMQGIQHAPIPRDFNGDGHPDIVFRNTSTGANQVWQMNGTTVVGTPALPAATDPGATLTLVADLNADGKPDLVWRNPTTGANTVWYMNGTTVASTASLPPIADPAWSIVAAADINRDGWTDLIWRNNTTGVNVVWFMQGANRLAWAYLPTVADPAWTLVGAADMNQDGMPDLLWRNTTTGQNVLWYMNQTTITSFVTLPPFPDLNWTLTQAVDVDGDGWTDFVVHNAVTGENRVIYLNGIAVVGTQSFTTQADTNWVIVR